MIQRENRGANRGGQSARSAIRRQHDIEAGLRRLGKWQEYLRLCGAFETSFMHVGDDSHHLQFAGLSWLAARAMLRDYRMESVAQRAAGKKLSCKRSIHNRHPRSVFVVALLEGTPL